LTSTAKGSILLRWRLILGILLVAVLSLLCWLDLRSDHPGIYLFPLAIIVGLFCAQELLSMFHAGGHRPLAPTLYAAVLITLLSAGVPVFSHHQLEHAAWLSIGLAMGLILVLVGEMLRYRERGTAIINVALAAFAVLYVGGLLGFLVQVRLLPVAGDTQHGGMLAFLSLIVVVKFTDTGAYIIGKQYGRNAMAPLLSPGKTWEGTCGGIIFAILAAFVCFGPLARLLGVPSQQGWATWVGSAVIYGLVVGCAGVIGDLAESLLKRDVGVKDSSSWLPGLGGVLDLSDSLLVAAPVAYLWWRLGLTGWELLPAGV